MSVSPKLFVAPAIAAVILYKTLPGAVLCLFPGLMRQREEPPDEHPPEEEPPPITQAASALAGLGFERLGIRREKFPLAGSALSFDFVQKEEKTYASAYRVDRKTRRLYFFTPYDGGAAVLTADHRRPGAVQDGYYLAGGLPGAAPEQLWAAHRRQMAAMDETGRERVAQATLADRMATARIFFKGVGKREVRFRNLTSFFLAALALFVLYVSARTFPFAQLVRALHHP